MSRKKLLERHIDSTGVLKHTPRNWEGQMRSSFSMQRFDYRLDEFTRHSWANDEAEAIWGPRIGMICACIKELEWRAVLEGVRACALTSVIQAEFQAFSSMLAPYGLIVAPLKKIAARQGYTTFCTPPREGEPFDYWCAIGRVPDVQLLEAAQLSNDEEAVGRLLGYPPCCIHFKQLLTEERFIDTTWPMAQNTTEKRSITPTHIEISGASRCNILLQWIGPRIIFHLPCSFNCRPTLELAAKFMEIARSAGFHQEMEWLEEMLSWPVEWSALYGLAEIATPVGTVSTVTDATAEEYRVTYIGAGKPEE